MLSKKYRFNALIIALLVGLAGFAFIKLDHWLEVDRCLDAGGRFNFELNECQLSSQ